MKRLHSFALYALLTPAITLGAGSVLAEQYSGQNIDRERQSTLDQSRMQNRGYMANVPARGMQASNLIGAKVTTKDGEKVGPVDDLIIGENGQIVGIVVSVGGLLGMGQRDVAIGWDDVTRTGAGDKQELQVDVTRESLRSAPEFKVLAEQSTGQASDRERQTTQRDQDARQSTRMTQSDQDDWQSTRMTQSDQSSLSASQYDSDTALDRQSTLGQSRMQSRGYMEAAPAQGMQASNIIGAQVRTTDDKNVGPVNDLIIGENGQVVAIVVSVGGFLGLGQREVAIGWDDVKKAGARDDLQLRIDVTRESLRAAPEYKTRN